MPFTCSQRFYFSLWLRRIRPGVWKNHTAPDNRSDLATVGKKLHYLTISIDSHESISIDLANI